MGKAADVRMGPRSSPHATDPPIKPEQGFPPDDDDILRLVELIQSHYNRKIYDSNQDLPPDIRANAAFMNMLRFGLQFGSSIEPAIQLCVKNAIDDLKKEIKGNVSEVMSDEVLEFMLDVERQVESFEERARKSDSFIKSMEDLTDTTSKMQSVIRDLEVNLESTSDMVVNILSGGGDMEFMQNMFPSVMLWFPNRPNLHADITQAATGVMAALGATVVRNEPAIEGSWVKRIWGRCIKPSTQSDLVQIGDYFIDAVRGKHIDKVNAEITRDLAEAVGHLVKCIQHEPNARICIGQLLVAKIEGIPYARLLTPDEYREIRLKPDLVGSLPIELHGSRHNIEPESMNITEKEGEQTA